MERLESDPTSVVERPSVDDDSWARPRPKATRAQKLLAAFLAAGCLSLTSFAVGVSVGKSRVPDAAGSGGFGRNAGLGGFGGGAAAGGGAATPGGGAASTPSTVSPTTTVDPNFGGLLPGLEVPPDTAAVVATLPPTTAPPGT